PRCIRAAPVNAPFSYPKSSASMRLLGIAPQLTAMNVAPARSLRSWIVRATSSLPLPDSPVMSTVAEVGATLSMRPYTSGIADDPSHHASRPPPEVPGRASRKRGAASRPTPSDDKGQGTSSVLQLPGSEGVCEIAPPLGMHWLGGSGALVST